MLRTSALEGSESCLADPVEFEEISPIPRVGATGLRPPATPSRSSMGNRGTHLAPRTPGTGLRVRTYSSANLFRLSRASSVPSFADLEAYTDQHSVTTITAEFARAYLQARKLLKAGAVKFPVVRSSDGTIVDCGNVYQWKKGVAARVASGELICTVITFVRNVNYNPCDPNSALFTEHAITGRAAQVAPAHGGADSDSAEAGSNLAVAGHSMLPMVAAESSAQGVRMSMEDETVILLDMNAVLEEDPSAIGLEQSAAYFAVFDGHGGKAAAQFSAKHLHFNVGRSAGWNRSSAARGSQHLRTSSIGSDSDSEMDSGREWDSSKARERDMIAGIEEGFLATDAQFLSKARRLSLTSGSTACVVIIQNRSLYCANLGDSRAVLCRKRKAIALCIDQNTESESEQERVVSDGGFIVSDGEDFRVGGILCVTRALGDYDVDRREKLRGISATPVVTTRALDDDDEFMLLACDGLWDVFSAQSAVDFARRLLVQEHAPAVVCEGLVAEALKRGSTDNVSVLLVRLGSKPIAAGTGRVGSGPRAAAMGSQRAVDATLPEDELKAKALELKRQGKYIPMHLKRYLAK